MIYFNNLHILIYLVVGIIGLIVGEITVWCYARLSENKKIFSLEIFSQFPEKDTLLMLCIATIYIFLLYKFGLNQKEVLKNIELVKYMILTPMLVLTFLIDLKYRRIPNRLTLTIFEVGIIITFLYGITNINLVKEYLLSSIVGIGIFGVITLLGRIIAGKEAMGLGDVKFIGAVGLYFEINSIIEISLLSFVISAIISIFVLLIRILKKKKDDYISFGPFLSFSCFMCIFLPSGVVMETFLNFCKMLGNKFV